MELSQSLESFPSKFKTIDFPTSYKIVLITTNKYSKVQT